MKFRYILPILVLIGLVASLSFCAEQSNSSAPQGKISSQPSQGALAKKN